MIPPTSKKTSIKILIFDFDILVSFDIEDVGVVNAESS
jgi:hypothetical protein